MAGIGIITGPRLRLWIGITEVRVVVIAIGFLAWIKGRFIVRRQALGLPGLGQYSLPNLILPATGGREGLLFALVHQ